MKKVLIAEDHKGIAETYKLILEANKYEVIVTENGQDCIETFDEYSSRLLPESEPNSGTSGWCAAGPFDLVVLDYHMPLVDGIDAAKHILSITPNQRILIASSYPREVIVRSAKTLDKCVELLLKPFDLNDFAKVVERGAPEIIGGSYKERDGGNGQLLKSAIVR